MSTDTSIRVDVANFNKQHPEYTAAVLVWENDVTEIIDRIGWDDDKDIDNEACEAARVLAAEQKYVAAQ